MATRDIHPANIPIVPKTVDKETQTFLDAVKSNIELLTGIIGNDSSRAVLIKDIESDDFLAKYIRESVVRYSPNPTQPAGTVSQEANNTFGPVPDPPTNFSVVEFDTDGINSSFCHTLKWTNPTDPNAWYVEVWYNTTDDVNTASRAAVATIQSPGSVQFYRNFEVSLTVDYFYWIRSVSYGRKFSGWVNDPGGGGLPIYGTATIEETIYNVLTALRGAGADTYDDEVDYAVGDRVNYVSLFDSQSRVYQCVLAHGPGVAAPNDSAVDPCDSITGSTNVSNWKRSGILLTGEVDGEDMVGIDGSMVVDGTIVARNMATKSIIISNFADDALTYIADADTAAIAAAATAAASADTTAAGTMATLMGYSDLAALVAAATAETTIIAGGYLNTSIINAGAIATSKIAITTGLSDLSSDFGLITNGKMGNTALTNYIDLDAEDEEDAIHFEDDDGNEVFVIQANGVGYLKHKLLNDRESQTFTSSGTFTVPVNVSTVYLTGCGGGGSGARGGSSDVYSGGGGAGESCIMFPVPGLTAGAEITVTIGSGGAAKTAAGDGNAGSSTSFGGHLTLNGASGGGRTYTGGPTAAGAKGSHRGGELTQIVDTYNYTIPQDGENSDIYQGGAATTYTSGGGASLLCAGGDGGNAAVGEDGDLGSGGGGSQTGYNSGAGGDGILTIYW